MSALSDRLFVALDVDTAGQALELVRTLSSYTRMFKVGPQLFTATGPQFLKEIIASGAKVFLDLKFHDIPNTVAAAAAQATRLGVFMFNVHASGGSEMMRRAVAASTETTQDKRARPLIIGVTTLTSMDSITLRETGISRPIEEQVVSLARLSWESGLNGVVASPQETKAIRKAIPSEDFIVVTPGVRPSETALNDQKRVMTPTAAIRAGANYLVVGRPITAAKDPAAAAQGILAEMATSVAV